MSSSEGEGPRSRTHKAATYHQESSRGAIFNGNTSGGNHTSTYGRGKNMVSDSHNHSKLKVTTTTITSNNFSTNVIINAATILEIIRTVFAFFNSAANRGGLAHPLHGEAESTDRDSSAVGPIYYNMDDSLPQDVDVGDVKDAEEGDYSQSSGTGSNQHASNDRLDDSYYEVLSLKSLDLASIEAASATNAEIYSRLMMNCGEGLPCWRPRPLAGTPGITPGDVGIFDFVDGFQKLFNVWDEEYAASWQVPIKTIRPVVDHFPEGHTIANGARSDIRRSQSRDKEYVDQFEFTCSNEQGAILAFTTSADLENLDDPDSLRVFLTRYAGRLYEQASSMKQRPVRSLYIVTGCVKSASWGLAAYRDAPAEQVLQLDKRFGDRNTSTDKGKIYDWVRRPGTGEARLWPNTPTEASTCGEKSHTLFLRGFKLAFSPSFSAKFEGKKVKSSGWRSSGVGHGTDKSKGSSNGPERTRGSTSGSEDSQPSSSASSPQAGSTNNSLSNYIHVESFPSTATTPPIHPCDSITSLLLQMTGADCALSHDDDWRHISRKGARSWKLNDAFDIIASKSISVLNGAAHLLPRDELSRRRASVLLTTRSPYDVGLFYDPKGDSARPYSSSPGATRIVHDSGGILSYPSATVWDSSGSNRYTESTIDGEPPSDANSAKRRRLSVSMDHDCLALEPHPTPNIHGAASTNRSRSQASVNSSTSVSSAKPPKQNPPRKARTQTQGRRPPKNMVTSQAAKILRGEDLWGVRLVREGFDPRTTSGDFGTSPLIDFNESGWSYPMSLTHARSSRLMGPEDLAPLASSLAHSLASSPDGDDPIPAEPKLASSHYDAQDLPLTPFNLDFQSGHSLHTQKQTPSFGISPSPGPSGQVSVTSIESVIDSDCSINVDNVNINDND